METYARSRATATTQTTTTFTAENFNKHKPPLYAAASKCGTTAFPPRPEDYSEIFGRFRSSSYSRVCSIPVLDLPAVSDIDCVTSVIDYSDIFAGFHAVDFAVPYDELLQPFDASDGGCSSDEAWIPVGTESLSDDSYLFASSEKSRCFSHEDSHQSLDNKKFTISYHKVNSGASSCIANMTRVEVVNEYTCVVDETVSPREMETERGRLIVADDIVFCLDSSSIMLRKHKSTTMSRNSLDAGLQPIDTDHTCERPCSDDSSISQANSKHAFISGTNLKMESSHLSPPSSPPSVLTERKGDIDRSSTGIKLSNGCASKLTVDSKLSPCFDIEVNVSSSAAVSAADMKDAMDKAHVKLKGAKVLLDRKDGLQDAVKPDLVRD